MLTSQDGSQGTPLMYILLIEANCCPVHIVLLSCQRSFSMLNSPPALPALTTTFQCKAMTLEWDAMKKRHKAMIDRVKVSNVWRSWVCNAHMQQNLRRPNHGVGLYLAADARAACFRTSLWVHHGHCGREPRHHRSARDCAAFTCHDSQSMVMVRLKGSALQCAGMLVCMASLKTQNGRGFYLEVAQLMA